MAALTDVPSLAAAISKDLAAAGIAHAVSGATAMAAHGFVRATRDLDILVVVPSLRLPEVFDTVRRHGFKGEDRDLIAALRDRYVAELRAGPISVEILVPAIPYHHSLPNRVVRKRISGVEVPFVSLEDLIVLKMLWRRAKDVADVQALVAAGGRSLDADYCRRTLSAILPAADPRHAELAGWIHSRTSPERDGDEPARRDP